jgi:hypothetical protein
MRSVTVNINCRCPLKCRHCSLGFSDSFHGNKTELSPADLESLIRSVDSRVYRMVLLAGGEPSLSPALIRTAIKACKNSGLLAAIVTAPIWARTASAAKTFLAGVAGLDFIILSYDRFHLEFLTFDNFVIAAKESFARGMFVGVEVSFTNEAEREQLVDSLGPLMSNVTAVNTMRVMPVGNAADASNVTLEYTQLDTVEDLANLPRACILGNALVDENLVVHGCCWARVAERSPFSVPSSNKSLESAFRILEASSVFQAVRERGFIDSLSQRGKEALVQSFKGQSFASECDLCVATMKRGPEDIWYECAKRKETSDVLSV